MNRRFALLLVVALAAPAFTGCLGLFGDEAVAPTDTRTDEEKLRDAVGNDTAGKIEERFSENPKVYLFPGQNALPTTVAYFNDTIDPGQMGGYEDKNDRGGNDYNGLVETFDVKSLIPEGQPTELRITLYYASKVGASADLDLFIDVPGTKTSISRENTDEFNWKFTVKTLTVNTIGVAGANHLVGVQLQNGRVLLNPLVYSIKVTASYAQNVLTPAVPWAFEVPADATGIIVESEKAGGPENILAKFVLIDPRDEVVAYREYNDIEVPSESIYIPTKGPGQYVFYAYEMRGGFLSLKADAPLASRDVKALTTTEQLVTLAPGPVPGIGSRAPAVSNTTAPPANGGQDFPVKVETLPLEFQAYMKANSPSLALNSQATITGPKGLVHELLRYLRYDDERGSLGMSHDPWNSEYHPENLAKGDYTIHVVNSGNLEVGYRLVTYTR
ncbi:MAG TPA: hypothetical protein VNZ52_16000 [Candidatus Thermoplasmatota archaeon]|nr:hypothetical protein [Candidatus Thermoplasmatota archaeon]